MAEQGFGNAVWPGWETVRLIGRGSFGAVYEIQRDIFGNKERAALKVISIPQHQGDIEEMYSDGYDDESINATFQSHLQSIVNEYSLMRRLNGSSNVVNCDDVLYIKHPDGIGWDIFIKMELLTPLPKALPEEIPEEQVIAVGRDICRALVLCRRHDIVHRDIKPQNIFVSDLGDYKLGDFGIAKTVERTSGGTKIGTYKYMAPEVYNNRPYGPAADIYSLGLVLYWMLNERRMPFLPMPPEKLRAGMEEEARLRRFQGEAIPAPAHGSERLKAIVLKACAYRPEDRYASAADMLADLENLGTAAPWVTRRQEPADGASEEGTVVLSGDDEPTFRGAGASRSAGHGAVHIPPASDPGPSSREEGTSVLDGENTVLLDEDTSVSPEEQTTVIQEEQTTVIRDTSAPDRFAPPEKVEAKRKGFIFAGIGVAAVILVLVIALTTGKGGSGTKTRPAATAAPRAAATATPRATETPAPKEQNAAATPAPTTTPGPAAAEEGSSIEIDVADGLTVVLAGDPEHDNQVQSIITSEDDIYRFEYDDRDRVVHIDRRAKDKWLASWDVEYDGDTIRGMWLTTSDGAAMEMTPDENSDVVIYRNPDGTAGAIDYFADWDPITDKGGLILDDLYFSGDGSFSFWLVSVDGESDVLEMSFDKSGYPESISFDTERDFRSEPSVTREDYYDGSLNYTGYQLNYYADNYYRFVLYDANGVVTSDQTYDKDWNLIDGPGAAPTAAPEATAAPTATPNSNYIAHLDGYWSDNRILLSGKTNTYPYLLYETVYNCTQLTMKINFEVASGSPNGWWALYVRKTDGQWYQIKDFLVDASYISGTKDVIVNFSTPTSFDGFAFAAQFYGSYSVYTNVEFTDAYLK